MRHLDGNDSALARQLADRLAAEDVFDGTYPSEEYCMIQPKLRDALVGLLRKWPEPDKDAQRMNWCERHLCRAGEVKNDAGQTVKLCRVWSIMGELETLRDTIDAAMTASTQEER